jgi:hypothetical protein
VALNIAMIFIFILEETHGACKYFRTKMVCTYLKKRNEPDVPEVVMQEAVRAVRERRLSRRVPASRYGITHTAVHYRNKNQ